VIVIGAGMVVSQAGIADTKRWEAAEITVGHGGGLKPFPGSVH